MKRKFECLTLAIIMCLSFSSMAFANTQAPTVSKSTKVENQIEPRTDGYYIWEITSKSSPKETYGSWKEACREYTDGTSTSTLTAELTATVSHTYTGSLQVPIPKLSSYMGLSVEIGDTWEESVSKSESLAGKSKGTWAIQWRPIYDSYDVTQVKYHIIDGSKIKEDTKVVTVNKYKSIGFRMQPISTNNVAR